MRLEESGMKLRVGKDGKRRLMYPQQVTGGSVSFEMEPIMDFQKLVNWVY